jgi:hypothetical protein
MFLLIFSLPHENVNSKRVGICFFGFGVVLGLELRASYYYLSHCASPGFFFFFFIIIIVVLGVHCDIYKSS